MEAAAAWYNKKPAPEHAQGATSFEKALSRLPLVKNPDGSATAKIRVDFKDRKVMSDGGGQVKVFTLDVSVTKDLVVELSLIHISEPTRH
eukprot:6805487-Karenia_brevis.AAC.1